VNAEAVVQVCRRLDGMPLPIELAAARAGGLPVETIAARLNQNFRMLTGGPRDVLPRHQTLRAALDWSWTLLSEQERTLLRRLSVFAGGWRLGAAVAVCAGNGIADWAVPDLLEGLVGKSLAGLDERDGVVRYRLLETVRRYADERQTVADEQVATRERHLAWCLALAEEAEETFKGREQGDRPALLEGEHDNLRAALAWSVGEKQNPTSGLRLAGALWRFWLTHGHLAEGRRWLERALATADTAPIDLRASALAGAGNLAHRHGDFARAGRLHDQGLALFRELGDERGIAGSLNGVGLVAWSLGDYGQAIAAFEECLSLWRGFEDRRGIAAALGNLGCVVRSQGDYRRAGELFEEALTLQRGLGHLLNSAIAMSNLGSILERQGDYERGAALYRESLALFRALGDTTGIAMALGNLGNPAHPSADFAQAKELLEESLSLFRGMEDLQGISGATAKLGRLAYLQGDYGQAEALYMESLNLARRVGEKEVICSALIHLGRTLHRRGDVTQALSHYREALRSATEMGARNLIAYSLECIAAGVAALGDAGQATQLLGAAERLRETIGIVLATGEAAEHEYVVQVMRASLGEEEFAAAWAEGQAMPLEQAATLARTAGSGH
jgi:tetratricopeptide (TPR) repeat protein